MEAQVRISNLLSKIETLKAQNRRLKAEEAPQFRLFYWPEFPGRGEFPRLLFAETATSYEDVYAKLTFEEAMAECYNNPSRFAVPAIESLGHVDPDTGEPLLLSQSAVIMQYLAGRCDGGRLLPESETQQFRAAVLMSDVVDVMEEGCKSWHAVNYNAGYAEQAKATQPFIEQFVESRLPKWLAHFHRALLRNRSKKNSDFFVGGNISYADLAIFHVLDGLRSEKSAGGGCAAGFETHASDELKTFMRNIESRPRIRAWLDSPQRCPFSQTGPGF